MSKSNSSYNVIIKGSKTPKKINNDEPCSGNTTNHDSLHNTKKSILKSYKSENKVNDKKNNFFMALESLRISVDTINENDYFEGINEYSETNPNQTKEENISKYIHRPIVKEIIKNGNNLKVIKPLTKFGTSINNPYVFDYHLGDIIGKFKNNKTEKKTINTKSNFKKIIAMQTTIANKNKFKKICGGQTNNKIRDDFVNLANKLDIDKIQIRNNNALSTNIKPFHVKKIIDDLEKPVEIKVKDYENKINIIKKNQELDKKIINKDKPSKFQLNRDQLKGLVKNLNFQEMSSNEKNGGKENVFSNREKNSQCITKIKKMLYSKINTATGEKIRKKYERSELKKNRMKRYSFNINDKNIVNLIESENKENLNFNNNKEELTKKLIKKINEMTTIKAEYNINNDDIKEIDNNLLYNFYKRKDNFYCTTKSNNVTKNLLNMFNSCSKKKNLDGSSFILENKSIKNINNSSFQEILDLFSDKSILTNNENEDNKTIIVKDTQKKLNMLKDFNSLFESNFISDNKNNYFFQNNSIKKELFFNDISPKIASSISEQKTKSEQGNKNNNAIIYYSPINQKIRNFDLSSPFNSSFFSNEYTLYNFPQAYGTDIKIKNAKKSQEIINKIMKNNLHGGLLELSESPSLINTQSPNSFNKPLYKFEQNNEVINLSISDSSNKNNNQDILLHSELNSKNKSSILFDESQIPNTIYDISFYLNLIKQSSSYPNINPNKLFRKNPLINWEDRLKILLWMMKNCEEFAYKRDTFHYSLFYFDLFLYLSKEEIKKKDLKLIGITCISLSAKIEEVQIPKLIEYAKSIEPKCKDIDIIISMEQKICSTLKWKLIPITIETWLNWYTCQWDLFIDSSPDIIIQLKNYIKEDDIIYFKKQNDKAYCNYRRIYQLIDLISLDFNNYTFDKRGIVAACFFECITFEYNLDYCYEKNKLHSKKKEKEKNFTEIIQKLFNLFLEQSFDFSFDDKLVQSCIKYVMKFRDFSFSYNMPLIYKVGQKIDEDIENNYEDFISYQTTNSEIYSFFEKIYKMEEKKECKNIKKKILNIRK